MIARIFIGLISIFNCLAFANELRIPDDRIVHITCSPLDAEERVFLVFVSNKEGNLNEWTALVRARDSENVEFEADLNVGQEIRLSSEAENFSIGFKLDEEITLGGQSLGHPARLRLGDRSDIEFGCQIALFTDKGGAAPSASIREFGDHLIPLEFYGMGREMPYVRSSCRVEEDDGFFTYHVASVSIYQAKDRLEAVLFEEDPDTGRGRRWGKVVRENRSDTEIVFDDGTNNIATLEVADVTARPGVIAQRPDEPARCQLYDTLNPSESLQDAALCEFEFDSLGYGINVVKRESDGKYFAHGAAGFGAEGFPYSAFVSASEDRGAVTFAGKNLNLFVDFSKPLPDTTQVFESHARVFSDERVAQGRCRIPDYLPEDSRALMITMTGTGPGVDASSLEALAELIEGYSVASAFGKVVDYGPYGDEGGHRYCIELSRDAGFEVLEQAQPELLAIRPPKYSTYFRVEGQASCPED